MGVLPRNIEKHGTDLGYTLLYFSLAGTECLQARPRNHAWIWLTPPICHGENSILDGSNFQIP